MRKAIIHFDDWYLWALIAAVAIYVIVSMS